MYNPKIRPNRDIFLDIFQNFQRCFYRRLLLNFRRYHFQRSLIVSFLSCSNCILEQGEEGEIVKLENQFFYFRVWLSCDGIWSSEAGGWCQSILPKKNLFHHVQLMYLFINLLLNKWFLTDFNRKYPKRGSKQNFNLICIRFETLNIFCKIENYLEIGKRYCRMAQQIFYIVGRMSIWRRGINWIGGS